jgi:hypothetical protein
VISQTVDQIRRNWPNASSPHIQAIQAQSYHMSDFLSKNEKHSPSMCLLIGLDKLISLSGRFMLFLSYDLHSQTLLGVVKYEYKGSEVQKNPTEEARRVR